MMLCNQQLLIVVVACAAVAAATDKASSNPNEPDQASKRPPELPGVHVSPRTDRPGNPDVSVQTERLETSYLGPMDPLQSLVMAMKSFNGRIELDKDDTQCFYAVLLAGQFYIQDIQTVRFYQDEKFDVFLSNGQNQMVASDFQVSLFRHQLIVNHTNTYETCIVNRGQRKMLAYSSYRFIPPELVSGEHQIEKLHNFSNSAATSLGELEWRVTKVLSYVRGHSEIYKDTSALETTNWSIHWKAWATLGLQLLSVGITTHFIRRLFNEPKGKFALAT